MSGHFGWIDGGVTRADAAYWCNLHDAGLHRGGAGGGPDYAGDARATGVLIGGVCGAAVTLYIAFPSRFSLFPFSPLWPPVFGLLTTLLIGYSLSVLFGRAPARGAELSFGGVMSASAERLGAAEGQLTAQ